jgi:hypothetical protein
MLALLRLAVCAAMTGILWIVQLLVYPGFAEIPPQSWLCYHQNHCARISWLVAPLMVAELGLAAQWSWADHGWAAIFNLAGTIAGWLLTFFVSVPIHDRLGKGLNEPALTRRLVNTNWPRTILWSARLGLLLAVT